MKRCAFLLAGLLALWGCAETTEPQVKQTHYQPQTTNENKVEDEFKYFKSFVTQKFFNFEKNPIIKIHVTDFGGVFEGEPFLASYLRNYFIEQINMSSQLKLANSMEEKADCILESNIKSLSHKTYSFSYNVIDPENGSVLFSRTKVYNIEAVDKNRLAEFKFMKGTEKNMKSAIGNTRLVIQCFTDGGAFNETRDLYQTRSDKQMTFKGNAAYSGTSSMEGEYEGQASGAGSGRVTQNRTTSIIYGQSGFYPSEIKVTLNGSIYTPDADKILFDNEIRPGTYEVVASFREGSWDAYSQVQHKGRRYQKTFRVNVQKNEVVFLDLLFVYDGTNSDIQAKVQQR